MPRGAKLSGLRSRARGTAETLRLKPQAVRDRVASGLVDHHHDCLFFVFTFGILRRDGNAAEDSQIVKLALRLDDGAFTQRFSGLNSYLPGDDTRTCMFVSADQHSGDQFLAPFGDVIRQRDGGTRSWTPRWRQLLNVGCKARFREALIVVGRQDVVAVGGHVEFGIRLTFGRANDAKNFVFA